MPRQVRDASLETRTARARLKVRAKPYFRLIEPGLHLGYRKLASGPGTWIARRYNGAGRYTVENIRGLNQKLIMADDFSDADGVGILTFGQAQERAKSDRRAADGSGPLTVKQAIESYFARKEEDGRDVIDARYKAKAHIYPALGDVVCSKLTTDQIRKWHRAIAKSQARKRTKPGKAQKFRTDDDKDLVRRRQASANRIRTILIAALNQAFADEKIASDAAWRKVKPFKGVQKSRIRYLTIAESKRLVNACDVDFRQMVMAALQTGARYGQLARLTVEDFNPDAGTVRMTSRKGDGTEKTYHTKLTKEGVRFFKEACAGRTGDNVIFQNIGRLQRALERHRRGEQLADLITPGVGHGEWRASEQERPIADACVRAKIKPKISFHALRHTWASNAVMSGVPLLIVAKNLGHADTRMVEQHYGHLAPGYIADAIEAGAPKFGFTAGNVTALRG